MTTAKEHSFLIEGAAIHRPLLLLETDANDWDDWNWLGLGVNPAGAPSPAELTEVTTGEWHWVFGNGNTMAFPGAQIPHMYAEGTDIIPHAHIAATTAAAATGTLTARFFGILSPGNDVAPEAELVLTAAVSLPANKARYGYLITFDNVIPGLNRKISSCATLTLSYALTTGAGIILRGFDGHYQKDRLGSRQSTSKE